MSFLDKVGDDWVEAAGGEPEAEAQPEPEQVVEPEPELEVEPDPTPEPETTEEPKAAHTVPYAELKRERDKRQELERRLAEVNAAPRPAPQPQKVPDAYEQPEAFSGFIDEKFDQLDFNQRARFSGWKAEQTYGKELVEQAVQWAQDGNDPALGQKVRQSDAPVELVVQEYQRSRTLETLSGKSLEDYAKDYAVQKGWIVAEPGANMPPSPQPSTPTPPRSLASRPGSGGVGQVAKGDGFDIFASNGMGLKK